MLNDIRYALRTLFKSPVFAGVAVLSLALGIGANTAIFTLLNAILLRTMPVKNPEQIVLLTSRGSHYGNNRGGNALSYPMYTDYRDRNQVFNGVFCKYGTPLSMSYEGQTERVSGELVSGNYFQVLGVTAAHGRLITPDEDKTPGAHPVAVLSYDYWKTRFAENPAVIGKTIKLNSYPMTIIGVSAPEFYGVEAARSPQVRVPMMMKVQMTPGWDDTKNRRSRWVNVFARLKPGVSLEQAKASLQPIHHSILEMEVNEAAFKNASKYSRDQFLKGYMDLLPAAGGRNPGARELAKPLYVLMCTVGLVLLIACANLANLLMARATGRQKEIAVRLAMGAGRGRLVRQLLVESVLLSIIGGVAGIIVAFWTNRALMTFVPATDPPLTYDLSLDGRILLFNFGVAIATGLLFGLFPALQATKPDLAPTLKDQAGSVSGGVHVGFRKALVVAQVAVSLLLLIGAGLFIRSLQNLKLLDPGFQTENLLAFTIDPQLNGYSKEQTLQFFRTLAENIHSVPGVKAAGLAIVRLMEGNEWDSSIAVEGYTAKQGEDMNPYFNATTPGYFAAMGMPIVAGRDFTDADVKGAQKVGIVNEKFVKQYFGNKSAIGRHFGFGGDPGTKTDIEIVGVVKDAKYTGMREEIPRQVFVPYLQADYGGEMSSLVRTNLPATQMFAALRNEVRKLDPNIPVYKMRTMESQVEQSLAIERLVASLSTVFGLLATLLAVIGLYGVMAYTVARRSREIGIRMALGALGGNVLWLVMREVLILVAVGIAIGLPAGLALSRVVQNQLFGIQPHDVLTLASATGLLATVALLAGYIPAFRATRVDPIKILRYE
jgi:predicted permease